MNVVIAIKGDLILCEGDAADVMYFIISGSVTVVRGGECIGTLKGGSVIGEMALVTDSHRNATCQVRTTSPGQREQRGGARGGGRMTGPARAHHISPGGGGERQDTAPQSGASHAWLAS